MTERKQAEEALAEARRRSETILESITDAFVAVDRDWRFTYINERALRRMQVRAGGPVTREEMLGRNMWDAFPDAVGTEIHRRYREAMGGQRAVEFETYFEPSGEWIEAHAYPSDAGLSIYYRDVSERRRAEAETRRSETLLDGIADAFYAVDADWRFTYINERAVVVLGENLDEPLPHDAYLGRTVWEIFPDVLGTEIETHLRTAARERRTTVFEAFYEPSARWFDVHAYPADEGLVVYFRDITERKRAQAELERRARPAGARRRAGPAGARGPAGPGGAGRGGRRSRLGRSARRRWGSRRSFRAGSFSCCAPASGGAPARSGTRPASRAARHWWATRPWPASP